MTYYEQLVQAIDFIPNPRVRVKAPIRWGQSPALAPAERLDELQLIKFNADTTKDIRGTLQPGDLVQMLVGPEPKRGHPIRLQVFPRDGRQVGNAKNRVWIRWPGEAKAKRLLEIVEGDDLHWVPDEPHKYQNAGPEFKTIKKGPVR